VLAVLQIVAYVKPMPRREPPTQEQIPWCLSGRLAKQLTRSEASGGAEHAPAVHAVQVECSGVWSAVVSASVHGVVSRPKPDETRKASRTERIALCCVHRMDKVGPGKPGRQAVTHPVRACVLGRTQRGRSHHLLGLLVRITLPIPRDAAHELATTPLCPVQCLQM
jgi:hypothetical protein